MMKASYFNPLFFITLMFCIVRMFPQLRKVTIRANVHTETGTYMQTSLWQNRSTILLLFSPAAQLAPACTLLNAFVHLLFWWVHSDTYLGFKWRFSIKLLCLLFMGANSYYTACKTYQYIKSVRALCNTR